MINSQAKGKRAERDVVAWLKAHGWPSARRVVRTGDLYAPDEGDIRGLGPIVLEVKHHAGGLTDGQVSAFLEKLRTRQCQDEELGILIERRERVTDVGRWWAWLDMSVLSHLIGAPPDGGGWWPSASPVRTDVRTAMHAARRWVGDDPSYAGVVDLSAATGVRWLPVVTVTGDHNSRVARNPFLDEGGTL